MNRAARPVSDRAACGYIITARPYPQYWFAPISPGSAAALRCWDRQGDQPRRGRAENAGSNCGDTARVVASRFYRFSRDLRRDPLAPRNRSRSIRRPFLAGTKRGGVGGKFMTGLLAFYPALPIVAAVAIAATLFAARVAFAIVYSDLYRYANRLSLLVSPEADQLPLEAVVLAVPPGKLPSTGFSSTPARPALGESQVSRVA
jgi:hypothetical protein